MKADAALFAEFRRLTQDFIIVPDAWDIMSAVVMQTCGYKAISTTSVGLGFAIGAPADIIIPRDDMLRVVRDICAAVKVPVSVDLESGYADTIDGVEEVVRMTIDAGAAAVALEDSDGVPGKALRPAEEHAERIRAARRAADKEKVALFINGRSDCFWLNDGKSDADKVAESIRRGNLYLDAGANGVFISSSRPLSPAILRELASGLRGPLSVLFSSPEIPVADYAGLGVKRLILGSLPMRAQTGYMMKALNAVKDTGDSSGFQQFAIPTKDINGLVRPFWQTTRT